MDPRTFVKVAIAAVVATVLALVSYSSTNQWSKGVVTGAKLVPALASGRAQVAAIAIAQGATTLTLESKGKQWSIKERGGYPADGEKVRALLVKLAEAELIEPKTRLPDRYALLELEDPKAKDAKSRALKLMDGKGGVIADVVVGKRRFEAFGTGRTGTYVRRPGDTLSWLASAEIDAPADVRSWIKPVVLETDAAKIVSLVIEVPGEEPLKIEKGAGPADKAAFGGLTVPAGKKLKDAGAADAVLRAAALIEADDVAKREANPAADAGIVRIATRDGLDLELRLRKDGAARWVAISAAGKTDAAKKEAEAIMGRAAGWEFKVPASKADALLKRRAELFEGS